MKLRGAGLVQRLAAISKQALTPDVLQHAWAGLDSTRQHRPWHPQCRQQAACRPVLHHALLACGSAPGLSTHMTSTQACVDHSWCAEALSEACSGRQGLLVGHACPGAPSRASPTADGCTWQDALHKKSTQALCRGHWLAMTAPSAPSTDHAQGDRTDVWFWPHGCWRSC